MQFIFLRDIRVVGPLPYTGAKFRSKCREKEGKRKETLSVKEGKRKETLSVKEGKRKETPSVVCCNAS